MELIRTEDLGKTYGEIEAVSQINLSIFRGETIGLVGESGSGKSTLGKMLLGFIPATKGKIFFKGEELPEKRTPFLSRQMQMIFQDPSSSLNPRMTVERILREPFQIHHLPPQVEELLDLVLLPLSFKNRYPHELSGGQKQRVAIARALALQPDLIVCDEPLSSLDVSIQMQIANLLQQLQKEKNLTYLFISHDLAMVKYLCNRIAVMYLGKIVEMGPSQELCCRPLHPYTQLLLDSIPRLGSCTITPEQ